MANGTAQASGPRTPPCPDRARGAELNLSTYSSEVFTHPTSSPVRSMRIGRLSGLLARVAMTVAAASVGLVLSTTPAQATNTLVVSGTARATSAVGASIVVGDTFSYSFTLNLDSTATGNNGSGGGFFANAVSAFSLSAGSGNVGTWSPAGVNWVISPVKNLTTNAGSDQMTLQVDATNAPPINSVAFFDLGITLDWDPSEVNIQPVSGSPSLGTTLGTFSPDPCLADNYFELRDTSFSSASFVASATQTPSCSTASGSTSSGSTPSGSTSSAPTPWLQSYGRTEGNICGLGWHASWAEWATSTTGGWVCNRTIFWNGSSWVQNPNAVWGITNPAETSSWDGS